MTDLILTLNAGSSSIKFAVFTVGLELLANGQVDGVGGAAKFSVRPRGDEKTERATQAADHQAALGEVLAWLANAQSGSRVVAVGHRVVHGGPDYAEPIRIDAARLQDLRRFTPLAPLHQPHNLAGVAAALAAFPDAVQVGCFDTAFHRRHPFVADTFALPRSFYDEGVRRYGFHGLSYEFIARRLREIAPDIAAGRVVVAHLGNGASMCALKNGVSVASSMGFTALDGLPMGTRCGQIDPGVLIYLMAEKGMNAAEISDLLYNRSGLKGLSGVSNDMRALEASDAPQAGEAIAYFVARIRREIGALAADLGGLDALVFTAGIGEHAADLRAAVLTDMEWLGLSLDAQANARNDRVISAAGSRATAFVIPTDEERMIAGHTAAVARVE